MEIIQLIIILVITFGLATIINVAERRIKDKGINKISFKEALDLSGLPIITFMCGKKKLNFMLDTGSTHSHISSEVRASLSDDEITETSPDNVIDVIGFTGERRTQGSILISLKYKDTEYPTEVFVSESLTKAFEDLKVSEGIQLHGILGNDFFNMYDYIIDFKEYIVHSKKKKRKWSMIE